MFTTLTDSWQTAPQLSRGAVLPSRCTSWLPLSAKPQITSSLITWRTTSRRVGHRRTKIRTVPPIAWDASISGWTQIYPEVRKCDRQLHTCRNACDIWNDTVRLAAHILGGMLHELQIPSVCCSCIVCDSLRRIYGRYWEVLKGCMWHKAGRWEMVLAALEPSAIIAYKDECGGWHLSTTFERSSKYLNYL